MPRTDAVLGSLMDMRIPLTFTEQDAALLADIITGVVEACASRP